MSLFKTSFLKDIRTKLEKEKGRISDDDWNVIVSEVEKDIRLKLKQSNIGQKIMFSLFRIAEQEENLVMEIDDINIGTTLRQLRPIYEWLKQKQTYFGW